MIGAMAPGRILGCGQVSPEVVAELRGTMACAAAWADGRPEDAGVWSQVLGEPTPEKRWLVACLCKTVAQQLAHYDDGQPLAEPEWPGSTEGGG
jgi:hypothetical protein